jgi:hypothetical protein
VFAKSLYTKILLFLVSRILSVQCDLLDNTTPTLTGRLHKFEFLIYFYTMKYKQAISTQKYTTMKYI